MESKVALNPAIWGNAPLAAGKAPGDGPDLVAGHGHGHDSSVVDEGQHGEHVAHDEVEGRSGLVPCRGTTKEQVGRRVARPDRGPDSVAVHQGEIGLIAGPKGG